MKNGGEAEAFFARIAGGLERVRVPYWPRLVPRGTMRGSPTVNSNASRGDLAILVDTTGGLMAGDMFSAGGQLFQCFQTCTASGGLLTIPTVNRVRNFIAAGSTVAWNRPTVTCLIPSLSSTASYQQGMMSGMPIDLEEA